MAARYRSSCESTYVTYMSDKVTSQWRKLVGKKNAPKNSRGDTFDHSLAKRTGKPYCGDYGMANPIKLNISASTLNVLRKQSDKNV